MVKKMKLKIDNKGVSVVVDRQGSFVLTAPQITMSLNDIAESVVLRRTKKGYKLEVLFSKLDLGESAVSAELEDEDLIEESLNDM
jgi:hypothetical protein